MPASLTLRLRLGPGFQQRRRDRDRCSPCGREAAVRASGRRFAPAPVGSA